MSSSAFWGSTSEDGGKRRLTYMETDSSGGRRSDPAKHRFSIVYEDPLTQHRVGVGSGRAGDEIMKSDSPIARCSVGARGSAHAETWYRREELPRGQSSTGKLRAH